MKELSIEKKAKAYDEALKQIKGCTPDENGFITIYPQEIFPELKESDGERIRKAISQCVFNMRGQFEKLYSVHHKDALAWLEKQGEQKFSDIDNKFLRMRETKPANIVEFLDRLTTVEQEFLWEHIEKVKKVDREEREQKPVDKTKPKFYEGDWVVSPNGVYWHIDKISNNRYEVTCNTGKGSGSWNLDTNIYHKFTIQDAKDGDVLSYRDGQWIFIYKGFGKEENEIAYYALLSDEGLTLNNYNYSVIESAFSPATKEERDTLMKAMADSGYTFDFEKKELKKIEQKPINKPKFKVKYAGSEYNVFETKDIAGVTFYGIEDEPNHIDYVKADNCEIISGYGIKESGLSFPTKPVMFSEQNPAWSEEDEIMIKVLDSIIRYIVEIVDKDALERFGTNREELFSWLKSLRPQNTWKPSDEQMLAINTAIKVLGKGTLNGKQLIELRKELKKLREE